MNLARYTELINNVDLLLTQEEVDEGWHFCYDWDGLLIHKDDPEYESCSCSAGGKYEHS